VQTATDPLVGRLLDRRYRVIDRIARGGMSMVYRAVDERLERPVAVKVMNPSLSADPAFTDRFAREAQVAVRLSHLNVVSVYDQGTDDGPDGPSVFLVMELVEGRTLRELIRERGGRFSPAEAISLMEPVLSALSAAHRAGVVHRDVKPENILLSDQGVVKVADFGLARAVNSDASLTRTGLMMGTVAYCAPEQITRGHVSPRTDIYAAGILLFELLTGRPPYDGDAMAVAYQHVHSRVPAPSSRGRTVPPELDELVVAATDRDPDCRPTDAADMLAEIADVRISLRLPVVPVPSRRPAPQMSPTEPLRTQPSPAGARTQQLGRGYHDTRVEAPRNPPPNRPVARPRPPARPPARSARARRRRRAWVFAVLILLLGALCVSAGVFAVHWARTVTAHVPEVGDRPLRSAENTLRHAHYRIGTVTTAFSETVSEGAVIASAPAAGEQLAPGRVVDLTVSIGKERYPLPRTTGSSLPAARRALADLPVRVAAQLGRAHSSSVPAGLVVGTRPTAGTRVPRGTLVVLVVSTGPPTVPVPQIANGETVAAAVAALDAAGLASSLDRSYDGGILGRVVAVDPAPGSAVPVGSTVTLTVL
jgi:serine/threonine-protein kinase